MARFENDVDTTQGNPCDKIYFPAFNKKKPISETFKVFSLIERISV